MKKVNYGKRFESDFLKSAEKAMFIYRLADPGSSFNLKCQGCPKLVTRFSVRNIADFIAFSNNTLYLLELKSHKGKSIPFDAIVKNEKDNRLWKMVEAEEKWKNVSSLVIINWRDCDNETHIIPAAKIHNYIYSSDRKSIPFSMTEDWWLLPHELKRVRYSYDMDFFTIEETNEPQYKAL